MMVTLNDKEAVELQRNEGRSLKEKALAAGNNLSLLIALIAICVVMGFTSKYFWTAENWMTLLLMGAILIIRASGTTPVMLTAGLDISQNSVGAFTAISVATLTYTHEYPLGVNLLIVIGMGLGLGGVNAVLIAILKINPLIATLGTMMIFRGCAWAVNEKTQIIKDRVLINMGRGRLMPLNDADGSQIFPGIPISAIIAIAIFLFIYWLMKYTVYGRKIYMIGGNETASFLSGIQANREKFIAYLISGVTAGYAGFLSACQVGAALPQAGAGNEMNTIAAVVLGGLSLAGGKGNMIGTILGCLILTVITNGLDLNQVASQKQMIVMGAVLVLAVLLDVIRSGQLKKQ
ncbi:MAG: ABC transporter permease [Clostridiales Family XIII bacterium]|jgi:ribose transport system permease protein|nr:ABC transporter permease [Clostridiales Family XIII bacterium]